ncbi:MAG: sulfur carrier protein ThiS [Phycisphaerae bacterium]
MQVFVNGEPRELDTDVSVAALLKQFELAPQRVAVEVNEQLVRRATFADTRLQSGDRVEIVTLVGGG